MTSATDSERQKEAITMEFAVLRSKLIRGDGGVKGLDGRKRLPVVFGLLVAVAVAMLAALSGFSAQPATASGGGGVLVWGYNQFGQLGNGTFPDSWESQYLRSTTPVNVTNLWAIKSIAGGCHHNLALRDDGTVWAWGNNQYGQLGDGTNMPRSTPVQVKNLSGVKAIAAGCIHSLALKEDNTVWAWGNNQYGQLGYGDNFDHSIPVKVQTLAGFKAIAAGSNHSLGVKGDNTVQVWGSNSSGQLGHETLTQSNLPVSVKTSNGGTLGNVKAVAGGGEHSLALKTDGTVVWAWGSNSSGQLGNGTNIDRWVPVKVQNLSGVKAIAAGKEHSLALKGDGTVRTWGENIVGQLGDGTKIDRWVPVKVQNLSGVKAIATGSGGVGIPWSVDGGHHSLALKEDGTVRAWGANYEGQLGDGTRFSSATPVSVRTSSGALLSGIGAIAAGNAHSLAARE